MFFEILRLLCYVIYTFNLSSILKIFPFFFFSFFLIDYFISLSFSLSPLFPGTNEVDQLSKIHDVLGTPDSTVLQKFKQ